MKHKVQLKLLHVLCILISMLHGSINTVEQKLNFDEVLATTPYATLLKELIGLTDTIGLLRHAIKKDEHRFIEDSVLGKVVRAKYLIKHVDFDYILPEDIEYLYYWLQVATNEPLSELLNECIVQFKQTLYEHTHKGLQADITR